MLAPVPHTSLVAKLGRVEWVSERERESGREREWVNESVFGGRTRGKEKRAAAQTLEWLLRDGFATPEEAKGPANLGMKCSPSPICSDKGQGEGKFCHWGLLVRSTKIVNMWVIEGSNANGWNGEKSGKKSKKNDLERGRRHCFCEIYFRVHHWNQGLIACGHSMLSFHVLLVCESFQQQKIQTMNLQETFVVF